MAKEKRESRPLAFGLNYEDRRVLWRTVLLASLLLGATLVVIYLLTGKLFAEHPKLLNATRTGISLLAFWIFITSTVRTYDRIRPNVVFFWIVLIGVATAALGIVLFLMGLRLWDDLGNHGADLPGYNIVGFYCLAGLVASLISLIHIRVENKNTGNLLELLVMVLAAGFFFWITRG